MTTLHHVCASVLLALCIQTASVSYCSATYAINLQASHCFGPYRCRTVSAALNSVTAAEMHDPRSPHSPKDMQLPGPSISDKKTTAQGQATITSGNCPQAQPDHIQKQAAAAALSFADLQQETRLNHQLLDNKAAPLPLHVHSQHTAVPADFSAGCQLSPVQVKQELSMLQQQQNNPFQHL